MARTEVLNEWFFPSKVRRYGHVIPAPEAALEKIAELRRWISNHPRLPKESPKFRMDPVTRDGQEGYCVRKEIEYK